MKTIILENENTRITEDAHIIDYGQLKNARIAVSSGVVARYTILPTSETKSREILLESGVDFVGKGVIASNGNLQIATEIIGDNVSSSLDILAIASDNADISVEGIARVNAPYQRAFTRVDQTNILIGKNTRIRGVPRLEIATDDIEGGHSCKIHRLHGDALFYLQSHGLDEKHAESFLLNSEILRHLDTLPSELKDEKCLKVHKMLFEKLETK